MTDRGPDTKTTPTEVSPADWERRGSEALNKVSDILRGPYLRLRNASDDYLHSTQGGNTPGIANSLDAEIKSAEVYRRVAQDDPFMKHLVDSAATLANQVEEQLSVIRGLAEPPKDHSKSLDGILEESSDLLKGLLNFESPGQFNNLAEKLTQSVKRGVDLVREGASSGPAASQKIVDVSEKTQNDFNEWLRSNYKDGYHETIPGYQRSLQAFAENAKSRNREYDERMRSIPMEVAGDVDSPVVTFIRDFRQAKFK